MKDILKTLVGHLVGLPEKIVSALPAKAQPYAKALVPLAGGAIAAAQDLTIDAVEVGGLKALAAGALVSLFVLWFPNLRPAPGS